MADQRLWIEYGISKEEDVKYSEMKNETINYFQLMKAFELFILTAGGNTIDSLLLSVIIDPNTSIILQGETQA